MYQRLNLLLSYSDTPTYMNLIQTLNLSSSPAVWAFLPLYSVLLTLYPKDLGPRPAPCSAPQYITLLVEDKLLRIDISYLDISYLDISYLDIQIFRTLMSAASRMFSSTLMSLNPIKENQKIILTQLLQLSQTFFQL